MCTFQDVDCHDILPRQLVIQFACVEIETIDVDLHYTNMCSSSLCVSLDFE